MLVALILCRTSTEPIKWNPWPGKGCAMAICWVGNTPKAELLACWQQQSWTILIPLQPACAVRTMDTYVVVLAVAVAQSLLDGDELWIAFGTGNSIHYLLDMGRSLHGQPGRLCLSSSVFPWQIALQVSLHHLSLWLRGLLSLYQDNYYQRCQQSAKEVFPEEELCFGSAHATCILQRWPDRAEMLPREWNKNALCVLDWLKHASNDRGNNIIVKRLEMIINHIRRYINRKYYYYYYYNIC